MAPSTLNLLDDDDEEEEDDGPIDPRYDQSPEIEPLVSKIVMINDSNDTLHIL